MQRSQIGDFKWSSNTTRNADSSNLWPELCHKNQVKHSARRKEFINIADNTRAVTLDNFEYPELGCDIVVRNKRPPVLREQINMEPSKSKSLKRYKRSDRICINLQEALESTRCLSKMNHKEVCNLRINLFNRNLGITVLNTLDRNRHSDFKRVKISISKDKKVSRLKKIILVNRDMKAQVNIEKREAFERTKMKAICRDVDEINFNTLKITSDPELDVDYVKNLHTMSLYDKSYRNTDDISISDDTVSYRPDVIDNISNLRIQRSQLSNRIIGISNTAGPSQSEYERLEDNIILRTFCLQIEDDINQEVEDAVEVHNKEIVKFSRNFREYCTNLLTPRLNESLEKLLQEIARFQKRYHEKNPNKSKCKRRYYSGMKEVCKHAGLNKLKFVIIAPDIEKIELEGGLDDRVNNLIDTCKKQNVVFCFGLRRRKLGYFTHGKGFVGCVGIANYSGAETFFKEVLTELVSARNEFKNQNGNAEATIDISKVISEDNLPSENINALLKVLLHYA